MIAAFDHIAPQYDQLWTRSAVGHLQREAVWRHIGVLFEPGRPSSTWAAVPGKTRCV
jgi:hypothetical protein